MMPWHHGHFLALDLETTGPDPLVDRIVTAAVVRIGGVAGPDARTWLIAPAIPIGEGATAVHGITDEYAREHGQPAEDVVPAIVAAVEGRPRGAPVVAYNARFDLTMLDREARRCGMTPIGERGRPLEVVDPLLVWRRLDRWRKGSRKLDAAAAAFGAPAVAGHEASADAMTAAEVAWQQVEHGQYVPGRYDSREDGQAEWDRLRHDVPALHTAQQRWAADQAMGLAEHFRRQGRHDEADRVSIAWPVDPVGPDENVAP